MRDRGDVDEDELRVARLVAARRCQVWTELDGPLIRRGPFWVDAESDRLYMPFRGAVWRPGAASIEYAGTLPLAFVVHRDELTLYECVTSPATWSEHVERQAKRKARASS
jgi:hypothetical protein